MQAKHGAPTRVLYGGGYRYEWLSELHSKYTPQNVARSVLVKKIGESSTQVKQADLLKISHVCHKLGEGHQANVVIRPKNDRGRVKTIGLGGAIINATDPPEVRSLMLQTQDQAGVAIPVHDIYYSREEDQCRRALYEGCKLAKYPLHSGRRSSIAWAPPSRLMDARTVILADSQGCSFGSHDFLAPGTAMIVLPGATIKQLLKPPRKEHFPMRSALLHGGQRTACYRQESARR